MPCVPAEQARHHGRGTGNDGAAAMPAARRDGVDGERGADIGDDGRVRGERMRTDGRHPAIRSQAPGIAIAVGDAVRALGRNGCIRA